MSYKTTFIYDEVAGCEVEVSEYVAPVAVAPAAVTCPVCKVTGQVATATSATTGDTFDFCPSCYEMFD